MPMPTDGYVAADSVATGAAVAAPGAGATVCQATIATPGIYDIEITLMVAATTETNLNNFQIAVGALTSSAPTVTGMSYKLRFNRVRVATVGLCRVSAIGAATAGSVYAAYITATRVG